MRLMILIIRLGLRTEDKFMSLSHPPTHNNKMKKQTKITQDKTQTRSTIPKVFVEEFEVTKDHKIEWDNKNGKLKGELKKDEKQ